MGWAPVGIVTVGRIEPSTFAVCLLLERARQPGEVATTPAIFGWLRSECVAR
jgi:hypothetical protein